MISPSCCNVRFFPFRYDFKRSPRFLSFFVDITTICLYIVAIQTIMGLLCEKVMIEDRKYHGIEKMALRDQPSSGQSRLAAGAVRG